MGPAGLRFVVAPRATLASSDPHPDPFAERRRVRAPVSRQLLGGHFQFESSSAELLSLVHWAYGDLPQHAFAARSPHFTVRLVLNGTAAHKSRTGPPELTLMGGAGFLGGVTGSGSFVALAPDAGGALVAVSGAMLKYPYHARYELLEFAVFTLAARAQRLTPLHAACVSLNDRGLLLMGASGAGKSTMALHCLLRQLDFVSEDAVFVRGQGLLATGIANFLHVRPDSLRWLSQQQARMIRTAPTIRRRSGVRKFEVDLRRESYRLAARPPKLCAAVFLSPRAGGRKLLRPLSVADTATRLSAAQPYAAGQASWKPFASSMKALRGYELRRGRHPQEGAELLHELLAGVR
jgi:hypothetical protein